MKLIVFSLLIGVAVAELVAPTNPPDYGKRNEAVYKYRNAAYGNGAYGHHGGYYGAGHHGGYGGYGYGGYGYGHGGHGYGYAKAYVAKPVSYGYGHSLNAYGAYGGYGGYGPYGGHHGYGYAKGHGYGYGAGLYQKVESHYGNTAFAYNDGGSTRKEHINADGTVVGSYSVVDANGNKRTVNYKAGPNGFEVDGDTGVDKATADAAAALAAQAPTAPPAPEVELPQAPEVPEVPDVELPVAPTNPPDYGKRNEAVYKARKGAYGHGHHGYYGGHYGGHGYGYGGRGYGHGYGYAKAYVAKPVSYGYGVVNHGNYGRKYW